jgi:endonuclease I
MKMNKKEGRKTCHLTKEDQKPSKDFHNLGPDIQISELLSK